MKVELAYDDQLEITDADLLSIEEPGIITYAASIPFKVTAHLNASSLSMHVLQIWSEGRRNGEINQQIPLQPGEDFSQTIEVPIGTANNVILHAALIDPFVQQSAADDQKNETVIGVQFNLLGAREAFDISDDDLKSWAGNGVNSLLDDVFNNRITANNVTELAVQENLTEAEARDLLGRYRQALSAEFSSIAGTGIDRMLDVADKPLTFRFGQKDPMKDAPTELFQSLPGAMTNGIQSKLAAGQQLIENLGEFVEIDLVSAGDLLQAIAQDDFARVKSFRSTGNIGDIFDNLVLFEYVGVKLPVKFDPNGDDPDGTVRFGFNEITADNGPKSLGVKFNVKIVKPITIHAIEIKPLNFDFDYRKAPNGGAEDLKANIFIKAEYKGGSN